MSLATLERDPFALLGPHAIEGGGVLVRAFHPAAQSIALRLTATGELLPMAPREPRGTFEARLTPDSTPDSRTPDSTPAHRLPDYRLHLTFPGGHVVDVDDPYRYGRVLTDFDVHLLGEGTHHRAF